METSGPCFGPVNPYRVLCTPALGGGARETFAELEYRELVFRHVKQRNSMID
jgi:hypothetical protein